MAAIDKTYTSSWDEYVALIKWAEQQEIEFTTVREWASPIRRKLVDYIYLHWKNDDFDGTARPVLYTPECVDRYLAIHCPLDFVVKRLKDVYAEDYEMLIAQEEK